MKLLSLMPLLLLAWSPILSAEEAAPDAVNTFRERAQKVADGLKYQQGEINLRGGLAKISVPSEFRFLGPEDAAKVLTQIWGNPPQETSPLGMILPANSSPTQPDAWAVIIEYEEGGYVKDDDASSINYDDLLKKMQASVRDENKEREKEGYPPVQLIGWAAPPRYDAATKKLYWAKELSFDGDSGHTLNYNIRMLGRRGVLVLNAVASVSALPEIEAAAPSILAMVDFKQGHRYADFNPSTDKVATYGLAALVAGGVLAKAGFFKVLLVGILALKKFVIIGLVAAGSFIKKLFFGKKEQL